jgi:hypothetical protein
VYVNLADDGQDGWQEKVWDDVEWNSVEEGDEFSSKHVNRKLGCVSCGEGQEKYLRELSLSCNHSRGVLHGIYEKREL